MKNNRREFCKMMAAGIVGAVLPVGTVKAKQKAGPRNDRAAAYNTGRNGGFLSVDEIREKENNNETGLRVNNEANPKITGYAHKYGIFTDVGFPCSFREKIKVGAFDEVLAAGDLDIPCIKNFDHKLILGSTKAGTLRLGTDAVGLRLEIDLPDTKLGRDTREDIHRGGINGVALACSPFMVAEDNWDWGIAKDDIPERTITRIQRIFAVSLNVKEVEKVPAE